MDKIEIPCPQSKLDAVGVDRNKREILEAAGLVFVSLPYIDITKEGSLPIPTTHLPWVLEHIREGSIYKEALVVQPRVIAVDGRPRPAFNNGQQRYPDDEQFLEPILSDSRKSKKIPKDISYGIGQVSLPEPSRFAVSPKEIHQVVFPQLGEKLRLTGGELRLPSLAEYLLLHEFFNQPPEIGEGTMELCFDQFLDETYRNHKNRPRLGHLTIGSDENSQTTIFWLPENQENESFNRQYRCGFRPVIEFTHYNR